MWSGYNEYGVDSNDDNEFTEVKFYRPDGDIEGKNIGWCRRSNGFFRIEEDLWSGKWYYDHFPEERPEESKECPVCKKRFGTDNAVNKHIRLNNGKSHRRYMRENNIVTGLTNEEKEEERARQEERKNEAIKMERSELLDTIYGGCGYSHEIAQAKRRLQEIDEMDYKFPCLVNQCRRRFETENDGLYHNHLLHTEGSAHKKEREKFGMKFHYPCPVAGCSRRFETAGGGNCHLLLLAIGEDSDKLHKKAHDDLRKGLLDFEHLYEPTEKSQTRITNFLVKKS
jgi:hypothetical protein